MAAVCLARPQYVLRSYWDSGNSRLPGREADMVELSVVGLRPDVDLLEGGKEETQSEERV